MKSSKIIIATVVLFAASLACNFGTQNIQSESNEEPPASKNIESTNESSDSVSPGITTTDDQQSETTTNEDEDLAPGPNSIVAGQPLSFDRQIFEVEPGVFNTYKSSLNYTFSAANGVTGTILMVGKNQLDPYATALEFQTLGQAVMGTEEKMLFTQFDGNEYIYSPDFGCISGPAGLQGNPFGIEIDTYGILSGEAAYGGEELINGIDTYVYEISNENIDPRDQAELGISNLSEGWIYIAQNGDFVVRTILSGTGINQGLSQDATLEGNVYYEINFYDFDTSMEFDLPAGCTELSQEETSVPLPEDAYEITQFGDILSFSTALTLPQTESFYTDVLPSFGCDDPEVVGDGSFMSSMNFENCEFGSIQIILTVEDEGTTIGTIFTAP